MAKGYKTKYPSHAHGKPYRQVQLSSGTMKLGYRKYAGLKKFRPGYDRTGGFYGRYAGSGGGEQKFHDVDVDDAVVTAAGTIQNTGSVNLIAQGTSESERIGRKVTIRKILWRYNVSLPALASTQNPGNDEIRVIMYLDKQANGATATVTGILASDDFQSFNNLSNTSRFRILMDRVHGPFKRTAGAGAGGAENDWSGEAANYTFFKTCNIPLEFSSTTGAITELRSNNIGVLLLSRAGSILTFGSKLRLRYSDN